MNLRLRLAVALKYRHQEDEAPRVLASGKGHLATRMIESALDHDIPLHEDASLADSLSDVAPGETIPTPLFAAVAEVLGMLHRTDASLRRLMGTEKL